MVDSFEKQPTPMADVIHPPWRQGQYVTYFLERHDDSWVAISLHVVAFEQETWILRGFFKTCLGECAMWFLSRPDSPAETMDPMPGKSERLRMVASTLSAEQRAREDPQNTTALAMNLLIVRRWAQTVDALRGPVRQVSFPCEINAAHLLVTAGPGYEKHHDLNPRVMLTGVACLSVNGKENPMTVTSFGCMDPRGSIGDLFEDFIDFGHMKRTVHDGFVLTYPATWFLLSGEAAANNEETRYRAQLGGVTCAGSFTVEIHRGGRDKLAEKRAALVARIGGTGRGPIGQLHPRKDSGMRLDAGAWGCVSDMTNPGIDGVICAGLFMSPSGDRLALVNGFGCIAKANPRRADTLVLMERTFREIIESFQFV